MSAAEAFQSYVEAFNRADVGAIGSLYAAATVYRNPFTPEPLTSPDAVRAFEQPMFDAFSDTTVTVEESVAEGDRVAGRVTVRARHTGEMASPAGAIPATQKTIELDIAEFMRTDSHGRIVEHHRIFDTGAFMAQLGLA